MDSMVLVGLIVCLPVSYWAVGIWTRRLDTDPVAPGYRLVIILGSGIIGACIGSVAQETLGYTYVSGASWIGTLLIPSIFVAAISAWQENRRAVPLEKSTDIQSNILRDGKKKHFQENQNELADENDFDPTECGKRTKPSESIGGSIALALIFLAFLLGAVLTVGSWLGIVENRASCPRYSDHLDGC